MMIHSFLMAYYQLYMPDELFNALSHDGYSTRRNILFFGARTTAELSITYHGLRISYMSDLTTTPKQLDKRLCRFRKCRGSIGTTRLCDWQFYTKDIILSTTT